ncbi:MAG: transporter substrate-binding domain-containing protein [Gammaproteobacteria bacterium]
MRFVPSIPSPLLGGSVRASARAAPLLLLFGVMLGLAGCGDDDAPTQAPERARAVAPAPVEKADPIPEGPDLDAIRARGQLRILVTSSPGGGRFLPRDGSPVAQQREMAEAFAISEGLDPVLIPTSRFGDLIPALEAGEADVAVANITVTPERKERIGFTVPITHVREQIVVRDGDEGIANAADLEGKRVMADPRTSFWASLRALREKHPGIVLVERPKGLGDEDELDLLVSGEVDAVVRDSNVVKMYLGYRDDIQVAFSLPGARDIAWGLPKDAPALRSALNHFLHLEQVDDPHDVLHTGDWADIVKRRRLRVLLRNNAASYFLYKGELMGFEYEMTKAFAKQHKLRLDIVVPPTHEDMITWLVDGRADMAVGFLEPLESRRAKGVDFSRHYHEAPVHLVAREKDALAGPDGLAGRTVTVRRSSSYWEILENLKKAGFDFTLEAAPEDIETEELISQVAEGAVDLTAADGQIFQVEMAQGVPVRSAFTMGDKHKHAVAVRKENTALRSKLDAFIKAQYKGLVYNILYKKYFVNRSSIARLQRGRVDTRPDGQLSPWDELVRKYSDQYGFDWRMVVAQMFQESRFDPTAKSFAGARGLMQVLPRTGHSMGFKKLDEPEIGLHAGIKYMDWLRDRFEDDLPVAPRTWFSLAAYNAGIGHVRDARRLARDLGLNPDRWFENTEKAMLLLSKKKYASKARHGYVRGREPVNYVRNIRERFEAYVELTDETLVGPRLYTGGRWMSAR